MHPKGSMGAPATLHTLANSPGLTSMACPVSPPHSSTPSTGSRQPLMPGLRAPARVHPSSMVALAMGSNPACILSSSLHIACLVLTHMCSLGMVRYARQTLNRAALVC